MRRFCRSSLTIAGLSLTALLSFTALSAHAQQSQYLLQFGQHETDEAARKQWNDLQKKYADVLKNKQLRVAEVVTGGTARYRTQASGVASREEAIQTCNTLNLQNVTCMVVETSMIAPVAKAADEPLTLEVAKAETPSAAPFFLPWLNKKEDAAAGKADEKTLVSTETVTINEQPAAVAEPVIVEEAVPVPPTLAAASVPVPPAPVVEPSVQAQPVVPVAQQPVTRIVPERAPKNLANATASPAPTPQAAEATSAVVEVAEAIPVPLSYNTFAPPARAVSRPVGYGGFPSQNLPDNAPWLQIGPFKHKDAAMAYWRDLSQQNPEMMRLLRVKISSSLGNRYSSNTYLRFGPFQDQASVDFLCGKATKEGLQCKGVREKGSSIAHTAPVERRYQQRTENSRMARSLSASRVTQNKVAGMYYLQLGAMSSAQEAKQRWEQLATVHKDLLGQLQPQVSYPANGNYAQPVYFLRTGPFVTAESAAQLCNRLKSRQLACVIVQAR